MNTRQAQSGMALVSTRMRGMQGPAAEEWWHLYETAFPATERRGAVQHAAALADTAFHCLHLADAAGFAGLLTYWRWKHLAYVEHLAIVPSRQGRGLGRAALAMLDAPVILEIEPVVDAATARRLAFYESCGFEKLSHHHVQLAYQTGEPDIVLWLLSRPAVDADTVADFERLFHAGPMRYRDGA